MLKGGLIIKKGGAALLLKMRQELSIRVSKKKQMR